MSDNGQSYYRRVLEELPGRGCPACREVNGAIDEYLRRTLYGRITDRRFRAAFDAAGGFCHSHARRLASFSDGLAISLLYETPLRESGASWSPRERLARWLRGVLPGGRNYRGFRVSGNCPACDRHEEFERHYLSVLRRYWDRRELEEAFKQSEGLCLPHYRRLLAGRRPPEWLEAFQQAKVERLDGALQRFVEYSNAGLQGRPELSRDDQLQWKEVLRFLYGERVLPDAELPPDRDAW
mgnify:CR=1 FL=1